MTYCFDVQVPLPGGDYWFTVCRCMSPESAAQVVRVLLAHTTGNRIQVFPVVVDDPPRPDDDKVESPPF